jgi:hypothetical protein
MSTKNTEETKPTANPDVASSDWLGAELEKLVKQKGSLSVRHSPGGSGMGLYWVADADGWPYCSAGTLRGAVKGLIESHKRLEKEALQKRINEIDASSGL